MLCLELTIAYYVSMDKATRCLGRPRLLLSLTLCVLQHSLDRLLCNSIRGHSSREGRDPSEPRRAKEILLSLEVAGP